MVVKEYKSAQAFLDDYETVLVEHESISQLVLYAAYQNCQNKTETEIGEIFGAVLDDAALYFLFCNSLSNSLKIYAVSQGNIEEAAVSLADYLNKNHIILSNIIAKNDICQSFMEQYKKNINCTFVEKLGMNIMELRMVNEIKPAEGKYRLALPEEAKLVAQWMIEFQMEALASEMDYEAALQKANTLIEKSKIYFYENTEKKVVSMAVVARKLAHGVTITYIFTPEENRGKGYAATNIYYLSKELLEQGNEFCTLFVDKKNPLSIRAYEKVGYKVMEENYEYKVVQALI